MSRGKITKSAWLAGAACIAASLTTRSFAAEPGADSLGDIPPVTNRADGYLLASAPTTVGGNREAAQPVARTARLNPTGRKIVMTVPLRADGPIGQVQVTLDTDDRISVSATDLANALGRFVLPAETAKLIAAASPDGQISAAAAAALGYPLAYDSEHVELVIQIPVSARSTRDVNLGLSNGDQSIRPDASAPIAAYLNYRIGGTYQISGFNRGEWNFLADLQLSGRIGRAFAFENFATVDQSAEHQFTRTASRVFYDIPGPALRLAAGDLITESVGFQTDPQIAGLNVSHLIDSFYPNTAKSGNSSRNLILNRDAEVQILVNGIPVSHIHLGPGSYDLRNLPITQGANNIEAVITDETGQRRVQRFSFFSNVQLLTPGLSEYTFSAGVLAPLGDNGPDYTSQAAFSGFYRRGITEQLTLGFDVQAARANQVLGLDGALGTKIGLFSINASGNRLRSGQIGTAARLQYTYAAQTNTVYIARTFDLSAEYRSKYFTPLNGFQSISFDETPIVGIPIPVPTFDLANLPVRNTQALLIAGSINQPIRQNLTLQINGNYSINRGDFGDTGAISALITYQAPFRTTFGVGVTYQKAPRNGIANLVSGRGFSALATITHRFGPQSTFTATADSFQQRATYSRSPSRPIDDYFLNADASRNRLGSSGSATAGYETNRGNIEATYNTSLDRSGHVVGQQTGGFFSGSLDLAGTRLGLGRQITDSFAVIGTDKSLEGRQLLIQTRFANQVVARSGLFGPAVVPLSSYNRQVIPFDVKDLPPGYDLGKGNFDVYPWFHSGFSLKVGSAYNISAMGVLVDADGLPISLVTGVARNTSDKLAPPVDVITNRAGRFSATGLAPGHYQIIMSGDQSLAYEFTVVKTPEMFMRFGTLRPQTQGK